MLRQANPKFINAIPFIFVAIGVFLIWVSNVNRADRQADLTNRNNQTGLTNQFYNRATNCFAAVTPTERTREHVEWCYDQAEEATGVKARRYSADHN